jgi:hypothetical protein
LAEVAEIQSKQPAEIKPLVVDFSDGLSEGETIASATVVAYQWNDRDQVSLEFDLEEDYPGADTVEIAIYAAGELLDRVEQSLADALTLLNVKASNENAWEAAAGMIDSVGWDTTTVYFKVLGGTAEQRYKITVTATTTDGHKFEQDVLLTVEEL